MVSELQSMANPPTYNSTVSLEEINKINALSFVKLDLSAV